MRKIVTPLLGTLLLASSLHAYGAQKRGSIKNLTFDVGYSNVDYVSSDSAAHVGLGFEGRGDLFIGGLNVNYEATEQAVTTTSWYGGVKITDNTVMYLQVGLTGIDSTSGITYGGGVKYQFYNYLAIKADYRTGTMSQSGIDIDDANIATISIELNGRTRK